MKISYNWLKKFIDIDIPVDELSAMLTDCGLEVESLEEYASVKGGLKGIIIGEVIQKEKHPDADRLSLTKVDIGTGKLLDIVCGAPNVEKGQKVLVATEGTKLYMSSGELIIKKSKIRGSFSEGMICAEDELGLGNSHDGIMVLPQEAPIGLEASKYLNVESDFIFEIGLTPNRADATSHLGVARDLYAVLKTRNYSNFSKIEIKPETIIDIYNEIDNLKIDIVIEDTEACPRYTGITMTGISVNPSPEYLQQKLKVIGLKPINNIVDISNYVLFDLGHPLHIFDADKIKGHKVVIKKYPKEYNFITLDGATQKMNSDDLMICNAEEPMCIAGIYGGLNSGVTNTTTRIFIESAYFNPLTIRRTSKRLGLKTDASFRFERGTDPNITVRALKEAVKMIEEIAGGQISSNIVDVYPIPVSNNLIAFKYEHFNKTSGKVIDKTIIKQILHSLEISIYKEEAHQLYLSVPPYRVDITREIDVIEEILRIYGFNNIEIPEQIKLSINNSSNTDVEKINHITCQFLTGIAYHEIMCNSLSKSDYYEQLNYFDNKKSVKLINPLSKDLETLRQTLLFSGLETIIYNHNRKTLDLKLFESGKIYQLDTTATSLGKYTETKYISFFQTGLIDNESWILERKKFSIYSLKADVFMLFKRLGVKTDLFKINDVIPSYFSQGISYEYKNKTLVSMGMLRNELLKYFDIKQEVFYAEVNFDVLIELTTASGLLYKEISRFPKVRRDLALLIDKSIRFTDIERIALNLHCKYLKEINLFDIYTGENIENTKKSYAVSFVFQDTEKTLTDNEVDAIMNKLISIYQKDINAVIR